MLNDFLHCLIFGLLISATLHGQEKVRIEIQYDNYENDTLLLAYHFGEKILIKDSLFDQGDNRFVYKSEEMLDPGMYMFVTKPDNNFFQILINKEDQVFEITTDFNDKNKTQVSGSEENKVFYDYLAYLNDRRTELTSLEAAVVNQEMSQTEADNAKKEISKKVEKHQYELINEYSDWVFSMIIGANMNLEIPEFEGSDEEKELQRYIYFREHYFDQINLASSITLWTPFLHKKVMYYLDNLTVTQPDSIIKSLDYLFDRMKPAETTFQYYLSHFLNYYGNSKYIGLDAVYVHLALEYYDKGLAPWVNEENLKEIVDNAKSMKPTLMGNIAPDFTTYSEDGTPFALSKYEANYTVLVFWAPDCGHCSKAMPFLVDLQEKYTANDVQVVSICNKAGKKFETCWEGVKEKGMTSFLNTGDQYMRSRVLSKYFVRSTPLILILDRDKKILLKKVPAENIDKIMGQIISKDQEEGEKG